MKTLPLGRSGVEVSALCFGAMLFGTRTDEETSRSLLDQYVDAGGTFIDTANVYAHWQPNGVGGESEMLLGRWMKDRGNRGSLFIASKVGFAYPGDELGGADKSLSADVIERECEKSLQRLGVETIDLYYAHNDDRDTPLEETLEAFDRLVRSGKVRFVAGSNYLAWRLAKALTFSDLKGWSRYVAVQNSHTYLRPRPWVDYRHWPPTDDEIMSCCAAEGVTPVAYSPLARGAYVREDRDFSGRVDFGLAENETRLVTLHAMAEAKGCTPNQLVLAWMLHSTPPVIPLFSVSNPEQLSENLGALKVELCDEEMETLNKAGR
jgi:aryl-alcohol dehydrogenase-like predicted oxidoreductase